VEQHFKGQFKIRWKNLKVKRHLFQGRGSTKVIGATFKTKKFLRKERGKGSFKKRWERYNVGLFVVPQRLSVEGSSK